MRLFGIVREFDPLALNAWVTEFLVVEGVLEVFEGTPDQINIVAPLDDPRYAWFCTSEEMDAVCGIE